MIAVISPAKSLDFKSKAITNVYSLPAFLPESKKINELLREMKKSDLMSMMSISAKLAELNVERNLRWETPFTPENAKQAILAFDGDVYDGLNATSFSEAEFEVAQQKVRILSGLYGILKPLDLIQPYRLEMGTRLSVDGNKDLYYFWRDKITQALNREVNQTGGVLINLASQEYFKAIDTEKLNGQVITPEFKDNKNGAYKIISFYAKKARGLMVRFMVENNLSDPEDLKAFDLEGYYFNSRLTKGTNWVFTRDK